MSVVAFPKIIDIPCVRKVSDISDALGGGMLIEYLDGHFATVRSSKEIERPFYFALLDEQGVEYFFGPFRVDELMIMLTPGRRGCGLDSSPV